MYLVRSLRLNGDGRSRIVGHCTVRQSTFRVYGHATVDDRLGDVGFSGTFESVEIKCFRYVTRLSSTATIMLVHRIYSLGS